MQPFLAFTIVMLVWTIGEFISAKSKARLSMMLVASMIFLIGFATDFFPHDLIQSSGLLYLGNAVVGVIIVHLGTTMSFEDLKKQWKTFVIGSLTVVVMTVILLILGQMIFARNVAVAGTAAITGGTLSILMVQERVQELVTAGTDLGLLSSYMLAVLPLLILNLKNFIGFLVTSNILKSEARRVQAEYRAGNLSFIEEEVEENLGEKEATRMPEVFQSAYGTLFLLGATVFVANFISQLTNGYLNTFVIALLLGIILRHFNIIQPNALSGTDSFGLLMISIMVIAFGPLADIVPADLLGLIVPILFYLFAGLAVIVLTSFILGKIVGYSSALAIAVGLTTLFGFPGTMVLTHEAARAIGETEEEIAVIEQSILPVMITGGFSTITITSVLTGGLIVSLFM